MTYVITEACIGVKDRACVDVCPVDCIYEGEDQLYIHPDECIDCGACEPECPVSAIFPEEDVPAKPYVSFVLTVVQWILIPVALLLACWGLPADIKDRSLHTVVTKPVRRSEIVIGRMLGYGMMTTLVLVIVALFGYVWIRRVVPERSQAQLISRVPVFSSAARSEAWLSDARRSCSSSRAASPGSGRGRTLSSMLKRASSVW